MQVAGSGELTCKFKGNIKKDDIRLKNVYFSQGSNSNLISVSQLDTLGYNFWFTRDHCYVKYKGGKGLMGIAHADGWSFFTAKSRSP